MDDMRRWKKALRQKLPFFDAPNDGPCEDSYAHVRLCEQLAAAYGVVRSQIPGHNPAT
jgi:predicted alpha/beta hydrolase